MWFRDRFTPSSSAGVTLFPLELKSFRSPFRVARMALHILQHKSWHVWVRSRHTLSFVRELHSQSHPPPLPQNEDNITKVRQDEAKAKAAEDEREKKFLAAEAEARLVRLRRAATGDETKDALAPELDILAAPPAVAGDADYEAERAKKEERERRALGIRDFKFEDVVRDQPWYATATAAEAELALRRQQLQRQRPSGRGRAPLPVAAGGEDEDPLVAMSERVAAARAAEARRLEEQPPPGLSLLPSWDGGRAEIPPRGSAGAAQALGGERPGTLRAARGRVHSHSRDRPSRPHSSDRDRPPRDGPPEAAPHEPSARRRRRRSSSSASGSRSSGSAEGRGASDAPGHRPHSRHRHHSHHRRHRHRHADDGGAAPLPSASANGAGGGGPAPTAPPSTSWDRLRLERLVREAEEHQRANAALVRATDGVAAGAGPAANSAAVAAALLETAGRSPHCRASQSALSSQYNPHLARQRGGGGGWGR